ncbi:Glutamate receptor 3.7 [Frankliniella fusca]|uniref:Glutamate receptor 3.7 n=1 Tax=Frankliniella fusca TaxID=407009 RepID=A0AAE1H1N1_9NEOP|nr:Glutamate receptor 3.7 [Frankliniella fusca]
MEAPWSLCLLLCCAVLGPGPAARAGLPVVVDLGPPPEARSAAALLSPFLKSQDASLLVVGRAPWTGAFLRELSPDVPRVLQRRGVHESSGRTVPDPGARTVMLALSTELDELLFTMRDFSIVSKTRTLFWCSVKHSPESAVERVSESKLFLGGRVAHLALTSPDGSTVLYRLSCDTVKFCGIRKMTVTKLNVWSPVVQRWLQKPDHFHDFCVGWLSTYGRRQLPTPRDLRVFLLASRRLTPTSPLTELAKSVPRWVGRDRWPRSGSAGPVSIKYQEVNLLDAFLRIGNCSLDALLADGPFVLFDSAPDVSVMVDGKMMEVVVIVPANAGPKVSFLTSLTAEFSASLWCATGLSVLTCSVAFLACARRRDASAAALQALAPLLGQATAPPVPPRPPLAVWLLACVVLTAAYQGLLLGKLSTTARHRELRSLRDLEDSGLPVSILMALRARLLLLQGFERLLNLTRERVVPYQDSATLIDAVATGRRSAFATYLDRYTESLLLPYMLPTRRRLHLLRLPLRERFLAAMTSRGSPLEEPVRTGLLRAAAAGLLKRWRLAELERSRANVAAQLAALSRPRALALWQLRPAFGVLVVGHAVSVACFALEAACSWGAGRLRVVAARAGGSP